MSYPSPNQGFYSTGYHDGFDDDDRPLLPRYMALAVLVLGLTSYLVSFGPMPDGQSEGWGVRFAVLAALLAGFGLIPRQTINYKVVAALAVAGFLDALSGLIEASERGWALTVIVVLIGLQSVAAIGGLLQAHPADGDDQAEMYQAYADYWAQMQYYGQYPPAPEAPEGLQRAGQAQGQADGRAVARAERSVSAQAAGYGEFVGNPSADATAVIPRYQAQPEGQAGQAGMPNAGHTNSPVSGPQTAGAAQAAVARPADGQ